MDGAERETGAAILSCSQHTWKPTSTRYTSKPNKGIDIVLGTQAAQWKVSISMRDSQMLLRSKFTARTMATLVTIFTSISLVAGQTLITAPNNKYLPSVDVKMGRDAARKVEQQMPLLRDSRV